MFKAAMISAILMALVSGAAVAQDLCKDILVNGTLAKDQRSNKLFYQYWLSARYNELSDEEKRKNVAASANIPFGDIVLGGSFNETDYRRYLREVSSSVDLSLVYNNQSSVLLSSGDPEIVGAWQDCMSRGRGLSVTFSPQSPRTVFLEIEWFAYPVAPGVSNQTQLVSNVVINKPGVKVTAGNECLEKDHVYSDRLTCTAQLEFDKGNTDLAVVVNTLHGSQSAYLPPRIKLVPERKGWVPDPATNEVGGYTLSTSKTSETLCHVAPSGWSFVTASLAVKTRLRATMTQSRCIPEINALASDQMCFRMIIGHTGKDAWCYGHAEGEIVRWNPVEAIN
jgi:hypothetical protein